MFYFLNFDPITIFYNNIAFKWLIINILPIPPARTGMPDTL